MGKQKFPRVNIQASEDALREFQEENKLFSHVDLLEKKRNWLIFDAKREEAKSLQEIRNSLKEQRNELESQTNGGDASASLKMNLERVVVKFKEAEAEYQEAKNSLKEVLKVAEKIAPNAKWKGRLDGADLPDSLYAIDEALVEGRRNINAIMETRKAVHCCEKRQRGVALLVDQLNLICKQMIPSEESFSCPKAKKKGKVNRVTSKEYADFVKKLEESGEWKGK